MMANAKLIEETFKSAKALNEFVLTLMSPKTYFKELEEREIEDFYLNSTKLFFELNKSYWGFVFELTQALAKGEGEEVIKAVNKAMDRFETAYAEYMNNAVVSAIINSINSAYLRSLANIQNFTSALLHAMGMVSRKDIIALSEAYVDLKGDIKKESRKIREEIRVLREELEKLKAGGSNVG
ncbi:MAG: hypothetical protein ACK401_05445 [Archaeoglobaceae archaeon]